MVKNINTATLDSFAQALVSPTANSVSTNEHSGYRNVGRTFNHGVVRHSAGEYTSGKFHTNSIEGFWSLLKRQIIRHHHVSEKHQHRYVAESAWRFNLRRIGEGQRVKAIMADANGHLRYKELIA